MTIALVVDDHADTRRLLITRLTQAGYTVHAYSTAEQALTELPTLDGCDIALLDVRLPGPMNGVNLCVELRHAHPQLPVIFISALMTPDDIMHARASTHVPTADTVYLTKPLMFSVLLSEMNRLTTVPS